MSSERAMIRPSRTSVRPHRQGAGSIVVRSRVRYRRSGIPSLLSVVRTSSPVVPGGTGSSVFGSTISGRKWSSAMCMPCRSAHSTATPGPVISESP